MLENRLAIASPSLGQHASHSLPSKVVAATQNGFQGLEITYPDLESYARSKSASMLEAAKQVRDLCNNQHITIISLCPFENFEGNLSPLDERLKKAETWLAIARQLGAEHLQVPSNFQRKINGNPKAIVSELQQLSDLAAAIQPVIKIAYENLAWSSHCSLWEEALQIVRDVDRDNFGLCLDSFHLSAALWGDPYSKLGIQDDGDRRLERSLQAYVKSCPLDKVFYIQLSDGELLDPPYSKDHPWYNPNLEVGHVWSNEARPFPLETELGAYMPVQRIAEAFITEKNFNGWVSLETFDRRMRQEENGPDKNARRGAQAWNNLKTKIMKAHNVA